MFQEGNQLSQLLVLVIIEPAHNGYSIINLVCEGLGWIVDDDGLGKVAAKYGKVLDVVSFDKDAVLSK